MTDKLNVLEVHGDPYQRGYQHGTAFKEEIRSFLEDDLARINKVRPQALSKAQALDIVQRSIPFLEKDIPALSQEIFGLAQGANIPYAEAVLLQLRRELIAEGLECTALMGKDASHRRFIAQNVDLPGNLKDLGLILKVNAHEENEPDVLLYTHIGLIGYLGLNSYQIGIGLNMVLSRGWREGVPPYLLIRHLLHQRSVDDCLHEIRRIRRASSRNLLLCDREQAVDVEMTVQEERYIRQENGIVHTNHYLHDDFIRQDRLANPSGSRSRLQRARELWQNDAAGSLATLQRILQDHQTPPTHICAHGSGEPDRGETVASVILYPEDGMLYAAKGNPCASTYHKFTL